MNTKLISIIAIVALGAVGAKFYTAPLLALGDIKEGFETKNADLIASHVDFEQLRENLKEKLLLDMAQKSKKTEKKGMEMIGQMMASSIADKMLSTYVTKSGLKMILAKEQKDKKAKLFEGVTYDGSFKDADTFAIVLHKDGKDDVHGVMKRDGLFGWKVVDMDRVK